MENIHDKLNYYYYYHFVLYIGSNKCVCQNKSPKKLISCSILLFMRKKKVVHTQLPTSTLGKKFDKLSGFVLE